MDMSLFVLLLLSGLLCNASGFQREYHYINQNMSWSEAQSYCRVRFTDLATVDSIDDVNRMINTVNDGYSGSVWIGLKRVTQGRWGWSNGENPISQYSNWFPGKPDGLFWKEYCILNSDGLWHDLICNYVLHFICYNESTGYTRVNIYKDWTDAQSYCRQYHTDLATIHTPEEQNQINAIVEAGRWVWIGLYYDFWQWSDQWSLFFRNWAAGFTSQTLGSGDCVAMSTTDSGKWIQVPCTEQCPFICYGDFKKQIVRFNFFHDGKYNLNDPSIQTAILNKVIEKLKSAGLETDNTINWRMDEGGEVFHPESKHTRVSSNQCDRN